MIRSFVRFVLSSALEPQRMMLVMSARALSCSSLGKRSKCHRSNLIETLLLLVSLRLIPIFCGAQALQSPSCLDVSSKYSKVMRTFGMKPSFVSSSALARRLFLKKTRVPHSTSLERTVPICIAKTSVTKSDIVCRQTLWKQIRIACVGDIHEQWDDIDESALRNLKPDLALFVGDYGDENVNITRRIAAFAQKVDFGVATVFGNHDAFYTASPNGRRRAPYNKAKICRVTEQMELLAPYDVSYRSAPFDGFDISVCGGRSFSVGGPNWKYNDFYQKFVGVYSLSHSSSKMIDAVCSSKHGRIVFLSHSGPVGLGNKPSDPCGKDWGKDPGGDYGDADLRDAIETAREQGFRVPLTVFGHMHSRLMHGQGHRTMLKTESDGETGYQTVMLNAAVFPRHKVGSQSSYKLRHFQLVELGESGYVDEVQEAWVSASGQIVERTVLFSTNTENDATVDEGEQVIVEKTYPSKRMPAG